MVNRQLKNISICMEWAVPDVGASQEMGHERQVFEQPGLLESSVFAASSAYHAGEVANLLRSPGSSLSLTLKASDDTISVIWQPETAPNLEPRSAVSRYPRGPPIYASVGRMKHTDTAMSPATTSIIIQWQNTRRNWRNQFNQDEQDFIVDNPILSSFIDLVFFLELSREDHATTREFYREDYREASKSFQHEYVEDLDEIVLKMGCMNRYILLFEHPYGSTEHMLLKLLWPVMDQAVRDYCQFAERTLLDPIKRGFSK